nr:PrpF domain-containing protein [Paracoccus indicus]
MDRIDVPDLGPIEASLVDASNPFVFIAADSVSMTGSEMPKDINADAGLMVKLEAIRVRASAMMGLTPDLDAAAAMVSIPKIAVLAAPVATSTLEEREVNPDEFDILANDLRRTGA